jgi:phosphatidylinositol-3-phosphatase
MELCRQPWRAIAGGLGALVLFAAWPAVAAVWTPDHVVIVIEENLSPRNLVPELTYLTGLMRDNTNFTNSHAIDHPSQPNYLALFSGDAQGTGSDARRNPDGSDFPTDDAGFAQLPTVAFVVPNQINDAHGSSAAPPGANYGLAMDAWLRAHIEPYRRWAMTHNSLLIITCDEDEDDYAPSPTPQARASPNATSI